jgi:hypothetical protein
VQSWEPHSQSSQSWSHRRPPFNHSLRGVRPVRGYDRSAAALRRDCAPSARRYPAQVVADGRTRRAGRRRPRGAERYDKYLSPRDFRGRRRRVGAERGAGSRRAGSAEPICTAATRKLSGFEGAYAFTLAACKCVRYVLSDAAGRGAEGAAAGKNLPASPFRACRSAAQSMQRHAARRDSDCFR